MFSFDKNIVDRREMLVRKLSKKNIVTTDWKIINLILDSYKKSDDFYEIKKLASKAYIKNAVTRWNNEQKISQAYFWSIENGVIDFLDTKIFLSKATGSVLIDGIDRALKCDLDDFHLNILRFAKEKYYLNYDRALEIIGLCIEKAQNFEQRRYCANAQRSIFYVQQDKWSMAEHGMRYLKNNPRIVDMGYCLHVASCASYSQHTESYAYTLKRILDDVFVILKDDKLFNLEYVAAFDTCLKVFSLGHAKAIVDKAVDKKLDKAEKIRKRYVELERKIGSWRWAADAAHRRIKAIARGDVNVNVPESNDFVVVLNSAAFGHNKIDYPGFRNDLLTCYRYIFAACQELGLNPYIDVNLGKHKTMHYGLPFVSYHTIGSDDSGVHFKETDRRHSFSFDRKGYSGWAKFVEKEFDALCDRSHDPDHNNDYYVFDYLKCIVEGASKYTQPEGVSEALPDKFILVALQLEVDAVHQLAFMSFEDMIEAVVKQAKAKGYGVVVKRHPYCKSESLSAYINKAVEAGDIVLSKGNIRQLIDKSSGVCVVNSSVGAEALIEKKPVYVFGRSEYMAACHVCKTPEDFARAFALGKPRLDEVAFEAFWKELRNSYAFDIRLSDAYERIRDIISEVAGIAVPEAIEETSCEPVALRV